MQTIVEAHHKAYAYKMFFQDGKPKQFPIDKINDASSAAKKLLKGTEQLEDGRINFIKGSIKFDAGEWVFLKNEFKNIRMATVEDGVIYNELKEVFNAKES